MAVVALVGAACGSGPPRPVVLSNTSNAPTESWSTVTGTWVGTAFQYDNRNRWPVTIVLHKAEVGDVMGTVDYPSYSCGGNLIRADDDNGAIILTESMTRLGNDCVDGATIRVRRVGADIDVRWVWAGMTAENARATLGLIGSDHGT
ncbi:MAG TPA: hypothetical protein VGM88_19435 [Kofleriaceae bacterium]